MNKTFTKNLPLTRSPAGPWLAYARWATARVGALGDLSRRGSATGYNTQINLSEIVSDAQLRQIVNGDTFKVYLSNLSFRTAKAGKCGTIRGVAITAVQGISRNVYGPVNNPANPIWSKGQPVYLNISFNGDDKVGEAEIFVSFNYTFTTKGNSFNYSQSGLVSLTARLGQRVTCPTQPTGGGNTGGGGGGGGGTTPTPTCTRTCPTGYRLDRVSCTCVCNRTCGPGLRLDRANCRCVAISTTRPTVNINVSHSTITTTTEVTVSWTSNNASYVNIPGIGTNLPTTGSRKVRLSRAESFVATAVDTQGQTAQDRAGVAYKRTATRSSACDSALNQYQYRGRPVFNTIPANEDRPPDTNCAVGSFYCYAGGKRAPINRSGQPSTNNVTPAECAEVQKACGCGGGTGRAPTACITKLQREGFTPLTQSRIRHSMGALNKNACVLFTSTTTNWCAKSRGDCTDSGSFDVTGGAIQGYYKSFDRSYLAKFRELITECGCYPVSDPQRCQTTSCPAGTRLNKEDCSCEVIPDPLALPDVDDITIDAGEVRTIKLPEATGGVGAKDYSLGYANEKYSRPPNRESSITRDGFNLTITGIAKDSTTPDWRWRDGLIWEVEDGAGTSRSRHFNVHVRATTPELHLPPQRDINYTKGGTGTTSEIVPAQRGVPSYSYALVGAPSGVTLSGTTITVAESTAVGTYTVTLRATDSASPAQIKTRAFTVKVNPKPVAPLVFPPQNDIVLNRGYNDDARTTSAIIPATGGVAPYTYTISAGGRTGVSIVDNASVLVSAGTVPGVHSLELQAEDSGGRTAKRTIAITVTECPGLSWADYELDNSGTPVDYFGTKGPYPRATAAVTTVAAQTGTIPVWAVNKCAPADAITYSVESASNVRLSSDGQNIEYTLPSDRSGTTVAATLRATPAGYEDESILLDFVLKKATKTCVAPRVLDEQSDTCVCPAVGAGRERVPGTQNCETRQTCSIRWENEDQYEVQGNTLVKNIALRYNQRYVDGEYAVNCYGERNITYEVLQWGIYRDSHLAAGTAGPALIMNTGSVNGQGSPQFRIDAPNTGFTTPSSMLMRARDEHGQTKLLRIRFTRLDRECPAPQVFNRRNHACECPPVPPGERRVPTETEPCKTEVLPSSCKFGFYPGFTKEVRRIKHVRRVQAPTRLRTAELCAKSSVHIERIVRGATVRGEPPVYSVRQISGLPVSGRPLEAVIYGGCGYRGGPAVAIHDYDFSKPGKRVFELKAVACGQEVKQIIELIVKGEPPKPLSWDNCVKEVSYDISVPYFAETRIPAPRAKDGVGPISYRVEGEGVSYDPANHELVIAERTEPRDQYVFVPRGVRVPFVFHATDGTNTVSTKYVVNPVPYNNENGSYPDEYTGLKTGYNTGETFWFDKTRNRTIDLPQAGGKVPFQKAVNDKAGDTTGITHALVPLNGAPAPAQLSGDSNTTFVANFVGFLAGTYDYNFTATKDGATLTQKVRVRVRDCDNKAGAAGCTQTTCNTGYEWNADNCACECVVLPETETQYFDPVSCSYKNKPTDCELNCDENHFPDYDRCVCVYEPVQPPVAAKPTECTLAWEEEVFNNGDLINYKISDNQTNIKLPVAVGCADPVYYVIRDLSGLDFTHLPEGHELVIQPSVGTYQYLITAISGQEFLSAVLNVEVIQDYADSSPYPLRIQKDVAARAELIEPNPLDKPSKLITTHFVGILRPNNTVARLPGTIIGGYKDLVPGAFYGVDSNGEIARVPIDPVTGKAAGTYFLRAVSEFELVILPRVSGRIGSE